MTSLTTLEIGNRFKLELRQNRKTEHGCIRLNLIGVNWGLDFQFDF
jgi:hypothetical protein